MSVVSNFVWTCFDLFSNSIFAVARRIESRYSVPQGRCSSPRLLCFSRFLRTNPRVSALFYLLLLLISFRQRRHLGRFSFLFKPVYANGNAIQVGDVTFSNLLFCEGFNRSVVMTVSLASFMHIFPSSFLRLIAKRLLFWSLLSETCTLIQRWSERIPTCSTSLPHSRSNLVQHAPV